MAQDHGITVPTNTSVADVMQIVSDGVRANARQVYQQLDPSLGTGMKFQSFQDQINNIDRAIREGLGFDPQRDQALAKRLEVITAQKNAAMQQIRAKGLDPDDLMGQADTLHKQSMALSEVSKAIRSYTDVHPSHAMDLYHRNQAAKQLDIAINGSPRRTASQQR